MTIVLQSSCRLTAHRNQTQEANVGIINFSISKKQTGKIKNTIFDRFSSSIAPVSYFRTANFSNIKKCTIYMNLTSTYSKTFQGRRTLNRGQLGAR